MDSLTLPKTHGKPPTDAQVKARARNFRVWRLRGLYSQVSALTGDRRTCAEAAIDQELDLMGAEPETNRHKKDA